MGIGYRGRSHPLPLHPKKQSTRITPIGALAGKTTAMNKKAAITYGIITSFAAIAGLLGIRFFDITIFGGNEPKPTIQTPSESQQPVQKKITYGTLQPENAPPFASVKRLPKARTSFSPAQPDSAKTLEFSRLLAILKDLPNSSDKFAFIEENKKSMPDKLPWLELNQILELFPNSSGKSRVIEMFLSLLAPNLSLDELHLILKMFPNADDRLIVIKAFLSRLPPALSLRELNRLFAEFYNASDKLDILRIFQPRLEPIYADSEFEAFRDHFSSSKDKKIALNLLLSGHN